MMRAGLVATVFVLVASAANSQADNVWRACSIENVVMCTPTGCARRQPEIAIYIGYHSSAGNRRAVYLRCAVGFRNCDRYDPEVRRLGTFVVFSLPERSVFSKLDDHDRLLDVAAVKDTVFISRGRCVEAAPPVRELRTPRG